MRKTLKEQIEAADRFYAIELGSRSNTGGQRFAVYALREGELEVLWPSDSHLDKSKELIPGMVFSKRRQYPAYHFHLTGYGYSKLGEIRDTLARIRKERETVLEVLQGHMPSRN